MWNDETAYHEGGAGGFDNTTNMFSSPVQNSSGKDATSKPKAIAPVAIKQILDCHEGDLKIKDIEVHLVKVVGIVKSVEKSTIRVTYTIEDASGIIQAVAFITSDNETLESPVIEDTYCIIIGSIRSQNDSKYIMIYSIYPITDFNEIIEHYLAVIHLPLKAETLNNTMIGEKQIKQELVSSYGSADTAVNTNYYDMDQKSKIVYDIISKSSSESGVSMDEIFSVNKKMSRDQVKVALDYLVSEGHVFTTIDENHFKSTESPF